MDYQQKNAAVSRRHITITSLIVRVIIGGLLSAVVLTAFVFLTSSSKSSVTFSGQNLVIRIISGIFYVAIMAPLARRVFYSRLPRFLAIFVPLYVTGTLTDLVEA